MGLDFHEIDGRELALNKESPRLVRKFRAVDTLPQTVGGDYFDYIASYVNAWVSLNARTYSTPYGTLYANTIQISENYYARRYEITVTYGKEEKLAGTYQIVVDGTGGTVHVTAGVRVSGWGPSGGGYDSSFGVPSGSTQITEPTSDEKIDNGGLIGVDGDDVRGVDIQVPHTSLTIMFRHPQAFLTASYINAILKLTGHPNADQFLGYSPGELKLIAPRFTETNTESTAEYVFDVSPNETDIQIGDITIAEKFGWDIISPCYVTEEDNNKTVRRVGYVEIIRPPLEWKNYAATFGWGGP